MLTINKLYLSEEMIDNAEATIKIKLKKREKEVDRERGGTGNELSRLKRKKCWQ